MWELSRLDDHQMNIILILFFDKFWLCCLNNNFYSKFSKTLQKILIWLYKITKNIAKYDKNVQKIFSNTFRQK